MSSHVNLSTESDGRTEEEQRGDVGTCLNVLECLAMLIWPKEKRGRRGGGRGFGRTRMNVGEVIPNDNVSRARREAQD